MKCLGGLFGGDGGGGGPGHGGGHSCDRRGLGRSETPFYRKCKCKTLEAKWCP